MVEIRTPRLSPTVRPAGQASTATASSLYEAGSAVQGVADKFSRYYEEKAAEEAELIWTQAEVDWARRFKEGAKTAKDGFTGKTMEEYDAYVADAMKTVPLRQVGNMEHNFSKYRIGLEAKALEAEAAARERARAAAKAKIRENLGHALLEDPTHDNFVRFSSGQDENTQKFLFGLYADSTLNSGDRFAVEDFNSLLVDQSSYDYLITPEQELNLRKGIGKAEDAFARQDAITIGKMIDDAAANAANTGTADIEEAKAIIEASYLDETTKMAALAELDDRAAFGEATFDIRDQPVSTSMEVLDTMRATASSDADWRNVGIYGDAIEKHQAAMVKDMAGYVSMTDRNIAALESAAFAQTGDMQAEGFNYYKSAMDAKYDRMGVPEAQRRYLSKARAGGMVATFNGMENGLTGPILENHLSQWGDAKPQIMSELVAEGLNNFVSWQLWRYDDPVLNKMAAEAKNADMGQIKDALTPDGYTQLKEDVYGNPTVQEYIVAFGAGRPPEADRFIRNMVESAIDMFAVHQVKNGTTSFDDFLKRAFSEKTLVEPNAIMILPDGVDSDMVNRETEFLLRNALTDLVPNISEELRDRIAVEENREIDDTVMALLLQNGRGTFILNDDGTGVRLAYNLNGLIVPLNPEFTFQELNLYSREHTAISGVTGKIIPAYRGVDDPNLRKDVEAGKITSTTRIKVGDKEIIYTPPAKGADYRKAFQ